MHAHIFSFNSRSSGSSTSNEYWQYLRLLTQPNDNKCLFDAHRTAITNRPIKHKSLLRTMANCVCLCVWRERERTGRSDAFMLCVCARARCFDTIRPMLPCKICSRAMDWQTGCTGVHHISPMAVDACIAHAHMRPD